MIRNRQRVDCRPASKFRWGVSGKHCACLHALPPSDLFSHLDYAEADNVACLGEDTSTATTDHAGLFPALDRRHGLTKRVVEWDATNRYARLVHVREFRQVSRARLLR